MLLLQRANPPQRIITSTSTMEHRCGTLPFNTQLQVDTWCVRLHALLRSPGNDPIRHVPGSGTVWSQGRARVFVNRRWPHIAATVCNRHHHRDPEKTPLDNPCPWCMEHIINMSRGKLEVSWVLVE